ncbi:MAG: hypothetical protein II192_05685, partial [Clostridia bacterium]|nr:hypothetical protein [Clostridia bacterium]
MKKFKPNRKFLLVLIDTLIFLFVTSGFFLLTQISGSAFPKRTFGEFSVSCVIFFACILLCRLLARAYSNVWRYANAYAYLQIVVADGVACLVGLLITSFFDSFYIGVW